MGLGESVVRVASLVAIFVGVITIVKELRAMVIAAILSVQHWHIDRCVLRVLKSLNPNGWYTVPDIAREAGKRRPQVLGSLQRLEAKRKASRLTGVDEEEGGLWSIHDWERADET